MAVSMLHSKYKLLTNRNSGVENKESEENIVEELHECLSQQVCEYISLHMTQSYAFKLYCVLYLLLGSITLHLNNKFKLYHLLPHEYLDSNWYSVIFYIRYTYNTTN